MAHTQGTTPRLQRLSALVAIAFVAIAVGFAFGRILVGHGATYRMIAVGLVSGVLAWATERRGMLLATLVSAAALLLTVTWLAVPHATWHALPTLTTVRSLGTLATLVGQQAREYVSPAPATPALVMAGAIAVWAAVFSCYALAFRAQSPLLALVPPLALVVFADSVLDDVAKPVYGVLFLIAALAVLFADSLRRIRAWGPVWSAVAGHDRLLPVAGSNARKVGATALVVAALAPLFVPGFGTTSVLDISRFGSDNRIRVSPLVQMGAILRDTKDNNPPFFEVQVDTNHLSYWRMVALDTFDGNTWQQRNDDGAQVANGSIQLPMTGDTVHQTFTILDDLGYSWLVAGGQPTSITIDHDVWWHPLSSSLTMDGWPDKGETYQVDSVYANPTPHDLREADTVPVGDGTETALPTGIPSVVKDKAEAWTASANTNYDRVMAIMQHLRVSGGFTYDPNVDLQDNPQSLADFLAQRKGFCQQFASLMAVMLRSIGIPARVGLGFTQGEPAANETGTYIVHGHDYHSWVEVPFNGYGWLTFDPTPGFADPSSSSYARVGASTPPCIAVQGHETCGLHPGEGPGGGANNPIPHPGGVKGQVNAAQATAATASQRRALGGITLPNLVTIAAVLGLLLGIGIPLLHWLRRRRRLHTAHDPRGLILATYDVFTDRARELGVGRSPGETPEEFRRKLAGADKLDGAAASLHRMTTEVVRAAYAAEDPDAETAASVRRDADEVLHAMRAATPLRERVIGRYRSG
jgi:transglutaminase-like putative cysteine protease